MSFKKSIIKRILDLDRENNIDDDDYIPTKIQKKMILPLVPKTPPPLPSKSVVVRTRRIVTKVTKIIIKCECNYTVTYQKYLYNGKNSSIRPISATTKNYTNKTPITVHTKREFEIVESP